MAATGQFLIERMPGFIASAFFSAAELKFPIRSPKALETSLQSSRKKNAQPDFSDEILCAALDRTDFPLKSRQDAFEKLHRNLLPMFNARQPRTPRGGPPLDILPSDLYPNGDPISVALRQKLEACLDGIDRGLPNAWLAVRECLLQSARDGARLVRAADSFSPEPPFDGCSMGGTLGYFQCVLETGNARECHARYVRAVHQCRRDRLTHSPIPGLP